MFDTTCSVGKAPNDKAADWEGECSIVLENCAHVPLELKMAYKDCARYSGESTAQIS